MRVPTRMAAPVVGLAMLLSACAPGPADPLGTGSPTPFGTGRGAPVVVGSASSTESAVLAELYAQAMKAQGVDASTRLNLGPREVYFRALQEGSVAVVPDYTGGLLLSLDQNATATTAAEVGQALPAALPPGLRVLASSAAADQDVYVVTRTFAARNKVSSLADLKKVRAGVTLGGPSELKERPYGPAGLTSIYWVPLKVFRPSASSTVRAQDLDGGTIQLASFFSTESVVAARGYVQLADPQSMILPQNVVPLTTATFADDPTGARAVESVQAALRTADLAALNERVDAAHVEPAQAARDWLQSKGLA